MDIQGLRDYQASCAVCHRSTEGEGECEKNCESDQLTFAVEAAEAQWLKLWIENTRKWVIHQAVKYTSQTFQNMKEARIATFSTEVRAVPYYTHYEYSQSRRHPPLHPQIIAGIEQRVRALEMDLYESMDADWQICVSRYPEILAHYYCLVKIQPPRGEPEPPASPPTSPAFLPSPPLQLSQKTRSTAGMSSQKRARRVSMNVPPPMVDEHMMEAMTRTFQNQRLGATMQHHPLPKPSMIHPGYDLPPVKISGKKRLTHEYAPTPGGKVRLPRAPTAPPASHSAWKPPPGYQ